MDSIKSSETLSTTDGESFEVADAASDGGKLTSAEKIAAWRRHHAMLPRDHYKAVHHAMLPRDHYKAVLRI